MSSLMPPYMDLGDLDEDRRIEMIGHRAMDHGEVVGFIVDDEPGKPERYIRKLKERFPSVTVIYQGKGPVPETVLVKIESS